MRTDGAAPSPVRWAILMFPFGATQSFVYVTLTFLITARGLSIGDGARVAGAYGLMLWVRFAFGPLQDVTLSAKRWYILSATGLAAAATATAMLPISSRTLGAMLVLAAAIGLFATANANAASTLMAASTAPGRRGNASGWNQAGATGGGVLGGALLAVANAPHGSVLMAAILGATILASSCALAGLDDVRPRAGSARDALASVGRDMKAMLGDRAALFAALMLFAPMNTGAAGIPLSQAAIAARWGAHDADVALAQGVLGSVATVVGALAGGWLADRLPPRIAYCCIGGSFAVLTALMALSPATPRAYTGWCLAYASMNGAAAGAWVALALEIIGAGARATKLSVLFALGNFPIWWVALADAHVAAAYGPPAMLLFEAALGLATLALIAIASRSIRGLALSGAGIK